MKLVKIYFFAIMTVFAMSASFSLTSCKKGSDDPVISLKTRKDRFTNTWTLTSYEKNGQPQDISGATYIYDTYNNGVVTQTVEGSIFGFATRTVTNGTWSFLNDDEDVKIILGEETTIYNIQRLASKELWLRKTDGSDIYVYYFSGK
jgi:hypothetical protein